MYPPNRPYSYGIPLPNKEALDDRTLFARIEDLLAQANAGQPVGDTSSAHARAATLAPDHEDYEILPEMRPAFRRLHQILEREYGGANGRGVDVHAGGSRHQLDFGPRRGVFGKEISAPSYGGLGGGRGREIRSIFSRGEHHGGGDLAARIQQDPQLAARLAATQNRVVDDWHEQIDGFRGGIGAPGARLGRGGFGHGGFS